MKKHLKTAGRAALNIAKNFWIYFVLIGVLLAIDLVTKKIFEYKNYELIKNLLYITYSENTGASFGILKGQQTLFMILTPISLIVFFGFMFMKNTPTFYKVGMAFIIAGTLGNFIDRVAFGYVRDFVHIKYLGHSVGTLGSDFPIFNFADNFLTAGLIMFAIFFIFHYKEEPKPKKGAAQESSTSATQDSNNT